VSSTRLPVSDSAARLESLIGRLMVWGVYLAMALIATGIVLAAIAGIDPLERGLEPALDPAGIVSAMLALRPEGFLWAGIVLIIAIPIARVVVAGVGFLATGERRFALISLLVLLVVLVSIITALGMES
jgi:uncharacterized membrane protein